jgi:hypothetical protein
VGKSGVEQESERIRLAEDDETASPHKGYLHARLPVETDSIQVADPAKVAAGLKSVLKVAEFTLKGPGLVRGIGALARLNQFDGIDCPGCAWPDPDHDLSFNEYCENGVKAIAEMKSAHLPRQFTASPSSQSTIRKFFVNFEVIPIRFVDHLANFTDVLFVIRNAKHSGANLILNSEKMPSTLRGERSESGRLPELRRYRICGEAGGLER